MIANQSLRRRSSSPLPREVDISKASLLAFKQPSMVAPLQTPEKVTPRRRALQRDDSSGHQKVLKFLDASLPLQFASPPHPEEETREVQVTPCAETRAESQARRFAETGLPAINTRESNAQGHNSVMSAHKDEVLSTIQEEVRVSLPNQIEFQASRSAPVLPDASLASLEESLQQILDAQVHKLAVTISDRFEARLADLEEKVRCVENRCAIDVENERSERRSELSAIEGSIMPKLYEIQRLLETHDEKTKQLMQDQDARVIAFRNEFDVALVRVAAHREDTTTMVLAESAEVRGKLDQYRQQVCSLRDKLENHFKRPQPQDILEQVTIQLIGMDEKQKSQQATINAVQKHVDELREIRSHFLQQHLESTVPEYMKKMFARQDPGDDAIASQDMRDYVSQLVVSCKDLKETSWRESEHLRSFIRNDLQLVRDDVGSLQSSVVGLLVCTKNLQQWKENHSDYVRRLEGKMLEIVGTNRSEVNDQS